MKPEWLEQLLIDRELGELDPPVEALLTEYLRTHPAAAMEARRWANVVAVARSVVGQTAPVVSVGRAWRWNCRALVRVAALTALAVGTGWFVVTRPARPVRPVQRENPAALLATAWCAYDVQFDALRGEYRVVPIEPRSTLP